MLVWEFRNCAAPQQYMARQHNGARFPLGASRKPEQLEAQLGAFISLFLLLWTCTFTFAAVRV